MHVLESCREAENTFKGILSSVTSYAGIFLLHTILLIDIHMPLHEIFLS